MRNIIYSDSRKGECDYCKSKDVSIYTPRELILYFRNILNLYNVDNESGIDILSALERDFTATIFSDKVEYKLDLLNSIIEDDNEEFGELLNNKVTSSLWKGEHSKKTDAIHTKWEEFKNEIKNINRFHIQAALDLEKLRKIFKNEVFETELKKGRIFYRSRISEKNGIEIEKMGNPPKDLATGGRANPKGISYLYLADNVKTSLYEARATLFDFVTVGDFRLKEDIKILNLREPENDPIIWAEQEAINDYLTYIPFIKTLQKELSLPIRKLDKEIDYLPTQYLSEFIKSIGYDGVEFQSSLNSDGYNLAIFNPDKFECIRTNIYEIESIELNHRKL
ncbi:RES family NAD+ phosphorylase [Marivirga sp.]|uniref:RES family NAD+ phosphorylase n=1 Tax=Marivirga sp. TaxID=2018662 RepID=UPI0025E6A0D0|nr:RES family NAD+ phosphorylase [Marivirga sp.]